jgi:diguanylate cyclase (GGDEF)-like protein
VIFLTSHDNAEIEIKGFDLGAVDFITKPFSTPVLLKRLETHINSDHILKETKNSLRDIENAAFLDTMTGLFNRNAYLSKRDALCSESCMPLGIVSGDVNFLKRINDTLGHNAGDRLLSVIAQAIKGILPVGAFAARTGGDELVILIPAGGKAAADKFIAAAEETLSAINDEVIGTPSVSWGTSEMISPDENYESLFALADERMYADKKRRKARRED